MPADVLSAALYARFRSRERESFSDKLLSAMRNKFGGHVEAEGGQMTSLARPAPPCVLVIFGAAGDLTKRLLMPALYNLRRASLLPENFAVIGVARSKKDDGAFRQELAASLREFADGTIADGDARLAYAPPVLSAGRLR